MTSEEIELINACEGSQTADVALEPDSLVRDGQRATDQSPSESEEWRKMLNEK